jgi:hypothetical protein
MYPFWHVKLEFWVGGINLNILWIQLDHNPNQLPCIVNKDTNCYHNYGFLIVYTSILILS